MREEGCGSYSSLQRVEQGEAKGILEGEGRTHGVGGGGGAHSYSFLQRQAEAKASSKVGGGRGRSLPLFVRIFNSIRVLRAFS